ncbi:phage tail tube protein [Thomasclavelia cocleata]|uniref:phage tail tube protein n=1 Tax=Thomasclavelia cocleata TaxID=69824 RepID=UPI002432E62D|nr:hypothetical protein [Thomasclavelia cocleata]
MGSSELLTNYGIKCEVNTSQSEAPTWSELGKGFDNIAEALNEVVQQYFFLNNGGYAENFVTGQAPSYTFTGYRVLGDAVQDFIFGKKHELLNARNTQIKITRVNSGGASTTVVTCDCIFCNMQEYGGASTDGTAISVEFRVNGKPEVTQGTVE